MKITRDMTKKEKKIQNMTGEEKKIRNMKFLKFKKNLELYITKCHITKDIDEKCNIFFQMFHYIDETFDIWNHLETMRDVIKTKLQMVVNFDNQPKHYIDYYLNLQCKLGYKNYCEATTRKNIRCRHNKHTGIYCNLHHNMNIKRRKQLNKFINKDVCNIIIKYL